MISLSSLADIILMIFWSNVVEHLRAVVYLAIQQLFEMVGRRDHYL